MIVKRQEENTGVHSQRDKQNITHTHIVSNIKKSGMLYMKKLQKHTLGEVRQTLKDKHIPFIC